MMNFLCLTFLASFLSAIPLRGEYEGHQVLRFTFQNEEQKHLLDALSENEELNLDLWSTVRRGDAIIADVRVPPESMSIVKEGLKSIEYEIFIANLQDVIDNETLEMLTPSFDSNIFSAYQSNDVLIDYANALPGALPFSIGKTFEGREVRGVALGSGPKQVVLHGGIHAREWITPGIFHLTKQQ
jgi:hypothetical protein